MAETGPAFASSNPIVQRLLAGTAAPQIKLAAARGVLPITQEELLHVLHALRDDPDPAIREALAQTIQGLEDETLAGLLRGPLPAPLLDFFARHATTQEQALSALVMNRSVSDATLELVASRASTTIVELIATNQVALIRSPRLIDTILANPSATADQRRRVLEVREEFFVKKELEERRKKDEEERLAKIRQKKEWSAHELEKLQEDLVKEALTDKETGALIPDTDAADADSEEVNQSAYQRLLNMSVPEKILLAIRGNRTERNLLIRDSNRLVSNSVIRSPKITDKDVEYFASLRNVSDDIPRIIGQKREWLKSYSIVLTLVKNPRTPLAIAINLLQRLQQRDLKMLETDRNVAETLRRQAKQTLEKQGKGQGGGHH